MSSNSLIFLSDVFVRDIESITDLVYKSFELDVDIINNDYNIYDDRTKKIPTQFTSLEEWPKLTSIKCWSCHDKFDSIPLFVPNKSINIPEGNFCTIPCVVRYINTKYKNNVDVRHLVIQMIKLIYGKRVTQLIESTDYTFKSEYGGPIDNKKYKSDLHKIHKESLGQ